MAESRLVRWAVLVEDAIQAVIITIVRSIGRRHPLIVPFVGHGTTHRARIGARVVLGRHTAAAQAIAGQGAAQRAGGQPVAAQAAAAAGTVRTRRPRRQVLLASLSRFLTVELPGMPVDIEVPGGSTTTVRSDREGYVDAVVELPELEPGWHEVRLSLPVAGTARAAATARTAGSARDAIAGEPAKVLVVDPRARIAVVSDVDDTILETGLTRGLAFLRASLLTEVDDRAPLPGAAALYRALATEPDGFARPVFYLSTSPWNLHETLLQFIALRGFPMGPLLLTDWGPGRTGLLRIGAREHKLTLIRRLLDEHPRLGLVLIGDSGQADPEIYAAVAEESAERVLAVYIRRTASTRPSRNAEVDALAARVTAAGVPMLAVDDSVQIAEHAASIGLLAGTALDAVRADTAAS